MANYNEYNNGQRYDRYEQYGQPAAYEEVYDEAPYVVEQHTLEAFNVLMRKVYLWMALALGVTGLTAYGVANSPSLISMIYSSQMVFWVIAIAEIGLVIGLSAAINKLSFSTAAIMFVVYSVLNGVMLSSIFLVYSQGSIAKTFFITAGAFVGLALIGYTTKRDLSGVGKFLIFALIGLIIASVVNMFTKSTGFDFIISIIGVLIFAGLTAYDTQKIKQMFMQVGTEVNDQTQKLAVLGALTVYLDFVNLFLYLLRFLGRSRDI